jgi:hypothetical protein
MEYVKNKLDDSAFAPPCCGTFLIPLLARRREQFLASSRINAPAVLNQEQQKSICESCLFFHSVYVRRVPAIILHRHGYQTFALCSFRAMDDISTTKSGAHHYLCLRQLNPLVLQGLPHPWGLHGLTGLP